MYLKPASVVNRVYLPLSIYSFRLVRLHFHPASAQTGGRLVQASSPPASAGRWHSTRTLPWGAVKGQGMAVPLLSTEPHSHRLLSADASGCRNKTCV